MEISGVGATPPPSPSFPVPQQTQTPSFPDPQTQTPSFVISQSPAPQSSNTQSQNTVIQETQQGQDSLALETSGSSGGQPPQGPAPQGPPQGLQASAGAHNQGPGQLVNIQV